MMRALGASAVLPAVAGTAFAQTTDDGAAGEGGRAIRPGFGYSDLAARDPPVEPDHEVVLDVRAPSEAFEQGQWFFDPVGLYIEPGETVRFDVRREIHTVSSYHPVFGYKLRVPRAEPVISSPILWPGTYFLYRFEREGVYDLMCLPHEFLGMVVRIVCGSATGPGTDPITPPEEVGNVTLYPPTDVGAKVLRAPQLRPERIIEAGRIRWDDIPPMYRG
ncbi:hypothetical protein [Halogeometricum luteum]|uniref:Blue (type 1) copper domain-containing protein n=1 Tax=Halogeometricum luteum TaxID=2950537 RepID=A0ABU2G5T7_9EURY|nr:hypothetical protein [Halogeometricum sp. S3BR5-2]MDS0296145.1 hypothetical protein [Halogeometricum sp. S3BR5-2]